VKDFQTKLVEFLTTRQEEILAAIRTKGAFDDEISNKLKAAVGQSPRPTPPNRVAVALRATGPPLGQRRLPQAT